MAKIYKFQTHAEAKRIYGSIKKYREVLKVQEEAQDEYRKIMERLSNIGISSDINSGLYGRKPGHE